MKVCSSQFCWNISCCIAPKLKEARNDVQIGDKQSNVQIEREKHFCEPGLLTVPRKQHQFWLLMWWTMATSPCYRSMMPMPQSVQSSVQETNLWQWETQRDRNPAKNHSTTKHKRDKTNSPSLQTFRVFSMGCTHWNLHWPPACNTKCILRISENQQHVL